MQGKKACIATLTGIAVLLGIAAASTVPRIFGTPPSPDELTWTARSLIPWWFPEPHILDRKEWPEGYARKYLLCLNHPSVARMYYRFVLHAIGITVPPPQTYDYSLSYRENIRQGHHLPRKTRLILRGSNAVLFAATVIIVYLAATRILQSRLFGFIATLPVVLEPMITVGHRGAVPYIGADAMLLFLTVLFWYVWLRLYNRGVGAILTLGVLLGLTLSTKFNGAFVLLGTVAFYLVYGRGVRRLWVPVLISSVCAAVFIMLNPVYWGSVTWAKVAFRDTLILLFTIKRNATSAAWGTYFSGEVVLCALPHLAFLVPAAAVVLSARRTWWFPVTFFWSSAMVFCNLVFMYLPQPRYVTLVRTAFIIMVMVSALDYARRKWRRDTACSAQCDGNSGFPVPAASHMGEDCA